MIDAPGQPFHDPEADEALMRTLEDKVDQTADRVLLRVPYNINDEGFAAAVLAALRRDHDEEKADGRFHVPRSLDRLREMVDRRVPIVGGGAGTGLSAKWEEAGGIDLIVIYNSGRYRMAGRGSLAGLLAYGNANDVVVEMASEVLPVVKHTPVLAGVNGTDPFYQPDSLPSGAHTTRLLRRAELPDRRPDRRGLPPEPGGDRNGVRPRGRDDPGRIAARHADDALRVQRRRRHGHGRRGRRHHRVSHGSHHRREHRRRDRADARRLCRAGRLPGRQRRGRSARTSSCCVTAGRSRCPTTPPTSCSGRRASTASTGPPAWSASRPNRR